MKKKKKAVKMTTDKTEKDGTLESTALVERIKESGALINFTLIALVCSVIIMDIIVYPITIFAVNNKNAYNIIFKYSFLTLSAGIIIYFILDRVLKLIKDGFSVSKIIIYSIKKIFSCIGIAFAFISISAAIISIIYRLLDLNNTFLSKITGS